MTSGEPLDASQTVPVAKALLNHQALSDATSRYIEVEWYRLAEVMQRIELSILSTAPKVFSLFMTPKYQPMFESPEADKHAK